jgi:capsular polysaccharide export protein
MGVAIHVLEEGYLRPNWITCESGGVNANSVLARIDLDKVDDLPPARDDETKLHATNLRYAFAGILYYAWSWLLTPAFPRYVSHRDLDILGEAALWLQRLFLLPVRRARTARAVRAIAQSGKPVHLVMLQLNGDSQIKVHSDFQSVRHFVEFCIAEFAASSAHDSLLVFKNHPLDNGVIDLNRLIHEEARRHGLEGRVLFVDTGKLVPLLERTVSATAVNSTACHQALLRGIPTMVLGRAVFNHPQIVPRMRLADFFRMRPCKSRADYDKLIGLMRRTCQFNGSYYSAEGRRILLPALTRALVDGMPGVDAFMTKADGLQATKQAS